MSIKSFADDWLYLGDGLYANFDGWQITLRANDPDDWKSPTVYMDEPTFDELVKFGGRAFVTVMTNER